jgi:CRP-like cAMP-binding protein
MQPPGLTEYWARTTPADWAEVLATFPLFAGVGKRRLRKLVRQARTAVYNRGDVVIEKGERSDSVHVILAGSARASGKSASRTLRTGDYFGELGVLGGVPRSATVLAADELQVMKLPRASFLRFAKDNPSVSRELLTRLESQFRRLEAQAA